MQIQLLRADITSLKLDAIVAPSAPASITNGRATVVTGGNLLARFVIEVPVPRGTDADADARLRDATREALERADELAVATIGLPVLGKRSFGFTTERCARAMLRATLDYRSRARSLHRAIFCLFGAEEHAEFERVLKELEP
ncbi:MAG TPA: macro domain-containing protein [Thermoanaerobaculia bacterium]|jgi:O-acetyl-ADP-ribose deacetylase (regulator of RNase III)|nr:macro domain-containing protein [Thermoanaerobaculia bacterium]